jgi:proteasome accessory factor A
MAIPKICGIETEYGILTRGAHLNAVNGSSILINAYVNDTSRRVGWDYMHERPGHDARGWGVDHMSPELEYHLVNAVLTNGARFYVDHAHPEISTPECRTAFEALLYDKAAEEIVRLSMERSKEFLSPDQEIVLYKNNSDGKGNSYGCHENYLVARSFPFGRLASLITPHFVTRQIYTGAGKVGCEASDSEPDSIAFQIGQRADFFEEEIGLETTLKRPIVNTRDEPHCDPQKYRRLHVIVGDANMSETATYLKVGSTAIILSMIEDEALVDPVMLSRPVPAMRQVSYDLTLSSLLQLEDGRKMSALEVQWTYFESARNYQHSHGLESVGISDGERIVDLWGRTLEALSTDPTSLAHTLDWVAKKRLIDGYADRHGLQPTDPRLKAIDLQYSDMRPDRGLASKVGLTRILDKEAVLQAIDDPPESTRAYFRGQCLKRWPESIAAANWDSMVFDIGDEPLKRIEMNEPLKGTRELVGDVIRMAASPRDLLRLLSG